MGKFVDNTFCFFAFFGRIRGKFVLASYYSVSLSVFVGCMCLFVCVSERVYVCMCEMAGGSEFVSLKSVEFCILLSSLRVLVYVYVNVCVCMCGEKGKVENEKVFYTYVFFINE